MRQSLAVCVLALATGCTAVMQAPATPSSVSQNPSVSPPTVEPDDTPQPVRFSIARVMRDVRALAALGPREATSEAFRRAAAIVKDRFASLGYSVDLRRFDVPGGTSWGIPVDAGETLNVVATPAGSVPSRAHVLVGAHLDTVPQAPGANDNASGVAIVLELARLAAATPPDLPIVFVAFGAEEPRAPGDDGHHYGSRHYARSADRDALLGVLSIDRVGFGSETLACTGGMSPTTLRRALMRAARRLDLPASTCLNRTSDHWPFERMGFTGARLDGGRFPGYHSRLDVFERVDRSQVRRTGLIAWEALRRLRAGRLR